MTRKTGHWLFANYAKNPILKCESLTSKIYGHIWLKVRDKVLISVSS